MEEGQGKRLLVIPDKLLVRLVVAAAGLTSIRLPWLPGFMATKIFDFVIPAQAGIQLINNSLHRKDKNKRPIG